MADTAPGFNNLEVRATGDGIFYAGPLGTTAPTDATTPLGAAMVNLGYVTEDGLAPKASKTEKDIMAMQKGGVNVRTTLTGAKESYEFTLLQTNPETIGFVFGTTVTQTATSGSYVTLPTRTGGQQCINFDLLDGPNIKRIWIPNAEVASYEEMPFKTGEAVSYKVTINAYYNSTIGGFTQRWDTALATGAV